MSGEKYDESAKKICGCYNCRSSEAMPCYRPEIAAALREVAAEAYEDAAKAVEDIDCYCCQHDEHPEGLCLIRAKAAALRTPPPAPKEKNRG